MPRQKHRACGCWRRCARSLPRGGETGGSGRPSRAGSFPLAPPRQSALIDMIRKPAERAGLPLPDELVDALVDDAGVHPGSLPLMAFALGELWPREGRGPALSLEAYDSVGRLGGAVGRRAAALGLDDATCPPWVDFLRNSFRSARTASSRDAAWILVFPTHRSEKSAFCSPAVTSGSGRWSWHTRYCSRPGRRLRLGCGETADHICGPARTGWRIGTMAAIKRRRDGASTARLSPARGQRVAEL